MSRRTWKQERRATLHREQFGLCFWCEEPMRLLDQYPKDGIVPPDVCTINHLRTRDNPTRRENTKGEQRLVAACHACNRERDHSRHRVDAMLRERYAA